MDREELRRWAIERATEMHQCGTASADLVAFAEAIEMYVVGGGSETAQAPRPYVRRSAEELAPYRARYEAGESVTAIARDAGVSAGALRILASRRGWARPHGPHYAAKVERLKNARAARRRNGASAN